MKRWAFNIFAGVSLALALTAMILGVRSYFVIDALDALDTLLVPYPMDRSLTIATSSGGVLFEYQYQEWRGGFAGGMAQGHPLIWNHRSAGIGYPTPYHAASDPRASINFNALGFGLVVIHEHSSLGDIERTISIVFPIFLLVAVGAILPMLWAVHFRRSRRASIRHLCANCGYDLRATPERCPECGTTPTRSG